MEIIDSQFFESNKSLHALKNKGVDVFGSFDKFLRWLNQENLALDSKPIELLSSESGIKKIIDILGRIEHGIMS